MYLYMCYYFKYMYMYLHERRTCPPGVAELKWAPAPTGPHLGPSRRYESSPTRMATGCLVAALGAGGSRELDAVLATP